MAHAIGIDAGSTNVKVALVDDEGRLVATASRPLATIRNGSAIEQDADELWTAVVDAVCDVTASHPAAAANVVAVAVCSQYSSIVAVGSDGDAVAPMRLYLDARGTDRSFAILERHPDAFAAWVDRHGIPPIGSGLSLGHMLHLQHDAPDVHAATTAWLEPMDYLNLRLTGRVAATQGSMFTAQVCDNRTLGVTTYDAQLVAMTGLDADRLPPLVAPDAIVGEVLPDVAARLGVPAGAVVPAAMNDSHAGVFATGAFHPGRTGLVIGTTAVLLDTAERMSVDLDHEVLTMPSPLPDRWLVWAENGMSGKAVEHVLVELLHASDELGDHRAADPFATLDEVLAATDAGAGGVLFLPWLAGSMSPRADRAARGGFVGLSLDTRRTDLVRAAIEGTAHNVAWLLPSVERCAGTPAEEIAFAGGAARSAGWAQVLADVLDRPVRTLEAPEHAVARAVAGVALARVGAASAPTLAEWLARPDLVPVAAHFEPDSQTRAVHATMQSAFEASFDALRPIFHSLRAPPPPGDQP